MHIDLEELYREYSAYLISIAYQMLGTIADAEDIVQQLFLELQQHDIKHIENIKAYLARAVTNRCINLLKAAHKRREVYVGPWLPEPQITSSEENPLELIVKQETLSYAILVLLERLSVVERAVYVLREVLGYSYEEIAETVHKSVTNCRKIYSRAQKKLQSELPSASIDRARENELAQIFVQASQTGSFDRFIQMLAEDAVLVMDGGGIVRAALRPIIGQQRIEALLQGIAPKGYFAGHLRAIQANGRIGMLLVRENKPVLVVCFGWDQQQRINRVFMLSNPEKLAHIQL